jgi:hypothetical protein
MMNMKENPMKANVHPVLEPMRACRLGLGAVDLKAMCEALLADDRRAFVEARDGFDLFMLYKPVAR